jgi:hypothetical protein
LVSACALADQIGSTYHCAPTNGLSIRTPGATLDTDELERELGATEEELLGTELDVVATLELLGTALEVVATLELLGTALDVVATLELLGTAELVVATEEEDLELGATLDGTLELPGTELVAPTMPYGAGCEVQVVREIQLLLFS